MQVREKVRNSRNTDNTVFFQCFVVPEVQKVSRLATAAGVGPSWEMRNEKLRALVARNRFGSENGKNIL